MSSCPRALVPSLVTVAVQSMNPLTSDEVGELVERYDDADIPFPTFAGAENEREVTLLQNSDNDVGELVDLLVKIRSHEVM